MNQKPLVTIFLVVSIGLFGSFGLGFILGPAIGSFLSRFGFAAPALFAAFVSLITVVFTTFFLQETVDISKNSQQKTSVPFSLTHIGNVLRMKPLGVLIIVFMLINLAFFSHAR